MAIITLKTGEPRAGKTLSAVAELSEMRKRWDSDSSQERPIYVFGVRDLKIPHEPLPVYPVTGKPGDEVPLNRVGQPSVRVAVDWGQVPAGAHVIIDEAHNVFPQRGPSAPVPAHVEFLAASGHDGITVTLITQGPKGLDTFVRERVGLHQHYKRLGLGFVNRMEWDACSTTLKGPRSATPVRQPKWAYGLYTSASEHQDGAKPRAPWWLLVPAGGVVLAIAAGPQIVRTVQGIGSGKGVSSAGVAPGAAASAPSGSPRPMFDPVAGGPVHPGQLPASAPEPTATGCIVMRNRCGCISPEGRLLDVSEAACRWSAQHSGKLVPFDLQPRQGLSLAGGPAGRLAEKAASVGHPPAAASSGPSSPLGPKS